MASQTFSQSANIVGWNPPDSNLSGTRVYEIYHSMLHYDYNVSTDGRQLLHVDNSSFTRGKPELTFHAGTDNNAPVVSVCKLPRFSRDLKFGFGDPKSPNDVVWEDMSAQGFTGRKYRIKVAIGSDRRSFLWDRSVFGSDFRLVDEQTQAVVAKFNSSHFGLKRSGRLEINKSYGSDFDLMVLSTAVGLGEKHRRQQSAGKGAPAVDGAFSASLGGGLGGGGGM